MQSSTYGQNYNKTSNHLPGAYPQHGYGRQKRGAKTLRYDASLTSNLLVHSILEESGLDFFSPMHQTVLTKGEYLYQQDDVVDYIYFPENAAISEFRLLEDGRMVEVAITGREGAVGIPSLFGPCLAANCAEVSHTGTALKVETALIRRQIAANPGLMLLMHDQMNHYIRQISQKVICNMYHSLEKRFCTWLLMLQDRTQRTLLKLTHEEIARILGVYRPSVTYIALEMRKQHIIDYSRGGIFICDRMELEKHTCDCYAELTANSSPDRASFARRAEAFEA